MAAQDYVVPPAYSYTTESSRRSDRINTVVRDLRSSVANYRDEERRLNESTRYPESVRSGADTQYENKVQKQNEILTKQLMFYRAQAGDLDKKLREATNLLESTVLEIQSKPGIGNSEELYLENQELKKRLQEILIKGGQADKIGTIGYSHQIAKLKQRIDKQNDELEASKVLYNQLRKKFDELNESKLLIEAGNVNDLRGNIQNDGDKSHEKEMNTEIERQKITINDLNEEIERMDEIIRANQISGRKTKYGVFVEQEDKIEELRRENIRLRSEKEKFEALEQNLHEKERILQDNIPTFNFNNKENFQQNFEKPTFEQPLPVSKNETFFLDDIPSEFKEDDVNFF